MERNLILALLLSSVLFALFLFVQARLFPPEPLPSPPAQSPAESKPAPASPPAAPVPPPRKVERPAVVPQRLVAVEGPIFRGMVGSDGGKLHEWVLRYRGDKPMVIGGTLGPRGLVLQRPGLEAGSVAFSVKEERLALGPGRPRGEVRLAGQDEFGLLVTEALGFHAQDFQIEVTIRLENRQTVPQAIEILLPWIAPKKWADGQKEGFLGQRPTRVIRLTGGQIHRDYDLEKVAELSEEGKWIALESEWYIAALIPLSPGFKVAIQKGPADTVQVALKAAPPPLAPGQAWEGRAVLYVGPKEYDRLKAVGVGLEETINWGQFFYIPFLSMEWVAIPLLWLMNFFHRYVPNYGVAIILLTILTKILFYPLTLKSLASMKAMQALQPQVNALKAKHQKDPQRAQRETMELYKKQGVNPMGGCLPMVVQIPIFYALYLVFSLSVELQNATFLCFGRLFGLELWICDLAQQDPTYVLPILMGVSMFVQQKMSPTVGDPRQAKIMLLMPVVFTFMFLNLPSGLVLYWFVSNVLQILQQHYMDRGGRSLKVAAK